MKPMDDNDVRQRLLNYNAGRASQEVIAAAAEITRLRARVAELEDANRGLVRLNEATQARAEAAEAQVAALTAQLATARADAPEEAAGVADGYHQRAIEWAKTVRGLEKHIGETDSSCIAAAIRALKDAKP
jgi:chromosome segregation ATPase